MSNEKEPIEGEVLDADAGSTDGSAVAKRESEKPKPTAARSKRAAQARKGSTTRKKAAPKKPAETTDVEANTAHEQPEAAPSVPAAAMGAETESPASAATGSESGDPAVPTQDDAEARGMPEAAPIAGTWSRKSATDEPRDSKSLRNSTRLPGAVAIALLMGVIGFAVYKTVDLSPVTASAPAPEPVFDSAGKATDNPDKAQNGADQRPVTTGEEAEQAAALAAEATGEAMTADHPARIEGSAATTAPEEVPANVAAVTAATGSTAPGPEEGPAIETAVVAAAPVDGSARPDPTPGATDDAAGWDRVIVSYMNPFSYMRMAGYAMSSVMQAWNNTAPPATE